MTAMPKFFSDIAAMSDFSISGEDSKHIQRVLRMKIGDEITVCDKNGTDYDCTIIAMNGDVVVRAHSQRKNQAEPPVKVTLYQALPKGDKADFIIQKATELGVFEINFVQTEFCVAKIEQKDIEKKLARFNKISEAAAKQSGRGIVPRVSEILSFNAAVERAASDENAVLFYESGGRQINELLKAPKSVSVFVGSEGGFSEKEVRLAAEKHISSATMGKLILRCETAPIVGLTLIMHECGIM